MVSANRIWAYSFRHIRFPGQPGRNQWGEDPIFTDTKMV
jgi:hypothetical protein